MLQKQHLWQSAVCASKKKHNSVVIRVARMTRQEINGFVCDFFPPVPNVNILLYCVLLCFLTDAGTYAVHGRATVPLYRPPQALSGPLHQYSWVIELAQTCEGVNPCFAARERVSSSYTRHKSHSVLNVFELFSPTLLFPRGIIFSRS